MKVFLLLMAIIGWAYTRTVVNCPKNCVCDKLMSWKRVKCNNKNLLNIGDDIPLSVEILDISYNQISELFEDEFANLGMTSIKSLNISHNKIGHMHLNAFNDMNKIRTIDLSFNIIEYILHEWFYKLHHLKELHLSNNNFFKIRSEGPLLESKSLEILDISYCKLVQLSADAFSKTPALLTLKLDGNFLVEVTPQLMHPLKNLQMLSVNENHFNCGKVMKDLKRFMKKSGVKYVDPCSKSKSSKIEKFQKMIKPTESIQSNVNIWMYEDENVVSKIPSDNCTVPNYERQELLMDIIQLSPILAIIVILATGVLLGMIIGCSIQIGSPKPNELRQRRRHSIIRKTFIENNDPLVLNCENIFESTPMMHRRAENYPSRSAR